MEVMKYMTYLSVPVLLLMISLQVISISQVKAQSSVAQPPMPLRPLSERALVSDMDAPMQGTYSIKKLMVESELDEEKNPFRILTTTRGVRFDVIVYVYTDPDTGCEYLLSMIGNRGYIRAKSGAPVLTPRLNDYSSPICSERGQMGK